MTESNLYCLIVNGEITDGPRALPSSWESVSNLDTINNISTLVALGWFPFVATQMPVVDSLTQRVTVQLVVGETTVTQAWTTKTLLAAEAQANLIAAHIAAIDAINKAAGECRAKYITVIPGQESTYQLKDVESQSAEALLATGGTPTAALYPMLFAEATATGISIADLITLVRTTAGQWKQLAAIIEGTRRGAIVAVEKATTTAELNAIQPVWP